MAFFRKHSPSRWYKNKFKQDKSIREPKAWIVTPTKQRALFVAGNYAPKKKRSTRFLRRHRKFLLRRLALRGAVARLRLFRRKKWAHISKVKRLYAKLLSYKFRGSQRKPVAKVGKRPVFSFYSRRRAYSYFRGNWKGAVYFFPKTVRPKRRVKVSKKAKKQAPTQWAFVTVKRFQPRFKKRAAVKRAMQHFKVPVKKYRNVFRNYYGRRVLPRGQGAFMMAVLGGATRSSQFFGQYKVEHARRHTATFKKQAAYEKRQRAREIRQGEHVPAYLGLASTARWKKTGKRKAWKVKGRFMLKSKAHIVRLGASSKRQKALLWRRSVLKRTRGFRFFFLSFKFKRKAAHRGRFSAVRLAGQKWHKRAFLLKRVTQLGYRSKLRGVGIPQIEVMQQKAIARLNAYRGSNKEHLRELKKEVARLSKKLDKLKTPIPEWKLKKRGFKKGGLKKRRGRFQCKTVATRNKLSGQRVLIKWNKRRKVKRVGYFGQILNTKQNVPNFQNKNRLPRFRWFRLSDNAFLVPNSFTAWGGADRGQLRNRFMRVTPKVHGRFNWWKTGFKVVQKARRVQVSKVVRANKVVALRAHISAYTPGLVAVQDSLQAGVINSPVLFTVKKVAQAFDFNKFFKVNKVATRAINNVSLDLYSQYITNLQMGTAEVVNFSEKTGSTNIRAARALRKYFKLLKQYFNEVHDRKMAKNIPASSAMHWIREYLRLTSSIKRRASLWNRFNRVTFHFRPKAKEDDKRGRKKKILFKAKILFDRLFKWLYAQPNARYALAAPIQSGVVRDYIVRNQFILKKGFKVKLPVTR